LGDIYWLVSLTPCEHLNFSGAHPPDELGNHSFAHAEGDGVGHMTEVRLESGGDVDGPQSSLEAGDFEATGNKLVAELLLAGVAGVEFLAGGQGAAVYGGDEPIGDGVDGLIDV